MSSTSSKLIELRRKTDRELTALIQRELERGLTLASVAATTRSPLLIKADKIYSKMKALLSALVGVDAAERTELEAKLHELRAALDRAPGKGMQRQMASSVLAAGG